MLKITLRKHGQSGPTSLLLEGRLAGPWVKELEQTWRTIRMTHASLVVDLTDVTFIEQEGKVLLTQMWREGAELLASDCCTKSIVEDIKQSGGTALAAQGGQESG